MKKFLLSILSILSVAFMASSQDTGSQETPMTVDEFLALDIPAAPVADTWVKGYIVGYIPGMTISEAIIGPADADAQKTNLLLAASATETDVNNCIPVQLPAGDVRNALNLVANPDNLGRLVTLCGSRQKYFGVNGLKSVTKYILGDAPVVPPAPVETLVTSLNETFATIPTFWTNVAAQGDKTFYATSFSGQSYAAMTGYKGTAPFDAWLISPAVDIEKCAEKVLTFDNQVNGYGATTTTFKAYVMTSNDPATATLTELPANWATPPASGYSDWTPSGTLDLSAYKGRIYIGFNYVASEDANYATWCVTNVKLNVGATPNPPVDPIGPEEDPLSVEEFLALGIPAAPVADTWVKGYIVGYIPGMTISEAIIGPADADAQNTNFLLAASATETDVNNCIPVQLPAGDVRNALNLVANPDNLGRLVTLCGSRQKYFGVNGLKGVTKYIFDDTPVVPPSGAKVIYEGLVSNADDFTLEQGELTGDLSYVWGWGDQYGLKASSYYNGAANPADAWAISPVIDLADYTDVTVSLTQAANFFKGTFDEQTFFGVREADTATGTWTRIELPEVPTSDSWTFIESGKASLEQFAGHKIQLGFNYRCDGVTSGTWEIKNLKVEGKDGSGAVSVGSILDTMSVRVNGHNIEAPAGARAYRINGVEAGLNNLDAGLYIVRVGSKAVKVVVK